MPVATQVKRRRGTAEENNAFTGAEGEITVDLTNKTLRVHDGETLGGTAVETQRNKSTTISTESTDAQYPSAKAVVDYVSTNSGGAMPVGAIFTTPRTGTIGGAVEANGGEYNIADYSGEGSIGALLTAGNIAYVSKTEFQTQVANTGACDSFGWNGGGGTFYGLQNNRLDTDRVWTKSPTPAVGGLVYDEGGNVIPNTTVTSINGDDISVTQTWDGGDTTKTYNMNAELNFTKTSDTTFLVPKLLDSSVRPDYSQSVQHVNSAPSSYTATEDCIIEVKGATLNYDLYSGSTEIIAEFAYSANYSSAWVFLPKGLTMKLRGTASQYNNFIITPVRSSNATRYMVQLATGATDQALETCTSVLSDVSELKAHRVIEFQAPTAENNYTWYRKYADGWVEQGGYIASDTNSYTAKPITLPVPMDSGNYQVQKTTHRGVSSTVSSEWGWWGDAPSSAPNNTSTIVYLSVASTSFCLGVYWQVSGMAA